jgi:mono/diheme cytochrome c family protein
MKKVVLYLGIAAVVVFGLIQLVPFGHDHTNPPTVSEPNWVSPEARALVKQSCFQCHSNETEWPWYSNVAPASWLIAMDVKEGREHLNFSDWQGNPGEVDEMAEEIQDGGMPPIQYWMFHPEAKLNDQQKQDLIQALEQSTQP